MELLKKALQGAQAERGLASVPASEPVAPEKTHDTGGSLQDVPLPDVEDVTRTEIRIVELDPMRLREQRIILGAEDDPARSTFNMLRTRVLQRLRENQWNMLGMTSPGEGGGKTTITINLSIALARELNQNVLLVDLDLPCPSVAQRLFGEALPGISECLGGEKEVAELLVNPGLERLIVLPAGQSVQYSSEALSSPKMGQLMEEIRTTDPDRVVLFDLPPVLVGDDVIAFLPHLDAILLVVEEGRTTKDELQRAYELLGDKKILGTVLNKSTDKRSRYGYGGYYSRPGPRKS